MNAGTSLCKEPLAISPFERYTDNCLQSIITKESKGIRHVSFYLRSHDRSNLFDP